MTNINEKFVKWFNKKFKDDILKVEISKSGSVEIYLNRFLSKFLGEPYSERSAFVYCNKYFYEIVENFANENNCRTMYNNAGTTFNFY